MRHPDYWRVEEVIASSEPLVFNRIKAIQPLQDIINKDRSRVIAQMGKKMAEDIDRQFTETLLYGTATIRLGRAEEADMRELLFQRPDFHKEINFTFRESTNWSTLASPGDFVLVVEVDPLTHIRKRITVARITNVMTSQIRDLPSDITAMSHDPACRTKRGVMARLNELYEGDITKNTVVTALGFRVYEEK